MPNQPLEGPGRRSKPTGRTTMGPDAAVDALLACSPSSASEARRRVVDACRQWARPHLCDVAELVAAELVTNAVRHARTGVRLHLAPTEEGMLVAVSDDSPALPRRRDPGPLDESGRGLWLVQAMARAWGVEPEAPGKRVWAEVTP